MIARNSTAIATVAVMLAGCSNTTDVAAICRPGYATSRRPPELYTAAIKRIMAWHAGTTVRANELDHIVPLELGGAGWWPGNMQLQPWPEARAKDRDEDRLHWQVCSGRLSITEAQSLMMTWRKKHD